MLRIMVACSTFFFQICETQIPNAVDGVGIKTKENQESSQRVCFAPTTLSLSNQGVSFLRRTSLAEELQVEQKEERSKASAAECNKCCLARPSACLTAPKARWCTKSTSRQGGGQEGTAARKAPATTSLAAPSFSKCWHKTQPTDVLKSSHFTQNPPLEKVLSELETPAS